MSSLRLALKQSLQETAATGAGNSSSEENEFHGEIDMENGGGQRHEEKNDSWKVTPPTEALCQRAGALGTATRDYVVAGLRVKVQFDGKYWYGGRIAAVSKDACRIRILYDDGSKEVSRFPDGVIVDATDNGKHEESVLENAKYFMGDDFDASKIVANKKRQQQLLQQQQLQQPATPKPEKKIELSKTMPDPVNPSPVSTKLSIATPKLSDVATSSVAATPKSPTPGTPGVIKRKRGRPRKHPLPEGTEVPPRSPHIPKKKNNIEAKKPLTIKIPGPNKVKQSLQQNQTPKDHDTTTTAAAASTPKKPSQSPRVGKKMKPKRTTPEDTTDPPLDHENRLNKNPKKRPTDDIMWIQCDACSKWRIVPKSVDTNEKWYCRDNIYDPKRASCDVPQQALKHKKKRQRIEEEDIPRHAPNDTSRPEESRTPTEDETTRQRAAKRSRELVENPVVVVKRGRGRPRRNAKEITTNIKTDDAAESADNLEWVQCETCGKWRKIAPHISATDLPEVWTCEMNDWNPASASCDAPEDKADGLQDTGVFGTSGSTGEDKMTYRHLIFGSTGRRVNRPVSERTRAAESIFSVQFDEEDVPSRVLYADSSAFVSRGRSNLHVDADDRVSVLQLMSKSNLWKELQAASKSITSNGALSRKNPPHLSVYSYENLPRDIQQAMKELVLFLLSYESYSVEEIVQNGRSSHDIPEGCRKAQVALTEQVVCTTLYQLVKEGKVECVEKQGNQAQCYRLFLANRSQCRRMASRCLKIAKPWKRPHSA